MDAILQWFVHAMFALIPSSLGTVQEAVSSARLPLENAGSTFHFSLLD